MDFSKSISMLIGLEFFSRLHLLSFFKVSLIELLHLKFKIKINLIKLALKKNNLKFLDSQNST
jgi:hypothetical protein